MGSRENVVMKESLDLRRRRVVPVDSGTVWKRSSFQVYGSSLRQQTGVNFNQVRSTRDVYKRHVINEEWSSLGLGFKISLLVRRPTKSSTSRSILSLSSLSVRKLSRNSACRCWAFNFQAWNRSLWRSGSKDFKRNNWVVLKFQQK